jgi:hypothetical protein
MPEIIPHIIRCNVSPSPNDVSPTENSWMLHPLDKVSLGYFAPDRTIPSLWFDWAKRHPTWSSMCGPSMHPTEGANPLNLVRGVGEAGQTPHWSIRPRRPTEAAIAADEASSMLDAVQGWDTSVRDTISKGRFVQGAQHPRIFGLWHIGMGHINPVSIINKWCHIYSFQTKKAAFFKKDISPFYSSNISPLSSSPMIILFILFHYHFYLHLYFLQLFH